MEMSHEDYKTWIEQSFAKAAKQGRISILKLGEEVDDCIFIGTQAQLAPKLRTATEFRAVVPTDLGFEVLCPRRRRGKGERKRNKGNRWR